jgi:hypothetical protein
MSDFGSKLHNIDQGVFNTTKTISSIPTVNLAFISNNNNVKPNLFSEASINLNPTYLNYSDFIQLFFRGYAGAFHLNPNNQNASVLSLTKQSYSTTHDSNNPFFLKEFLVKTYEKTQNVNSMNISIQTRINLDREMFLAKSLFSINGHQTALSLDECLNTLLMNGDIIKSDFDSSAKVIFVISLKYIQADLQVSGNVNFNFITDIPGFSNSDAIMTLDLPKAYSNDIKKNTKQDLGVKKEFYLANNNHDNDNSSEISGSEYNDLDDKSFSINSINSGISGTIINNHSNNSNNFDDSTIVTSSETLNTSLVKEVTDIIKSGESVINSVVW